MKKLLLAAILFLGAAPAHATWTLVQHKNGSCAAGTCSITVSSTGTGNVAIVGVSGSSTGNTISSVSGGGVWTHPGGCAGSDTNQYTDVAYTLATTSGATTVTITLTNSTGGTAAFSEYSSDASSGAFDACGTPANPAGTNVAGITVTISGTSDVIMQVISPGGNATAGSYASWFEGPSGFGFNGGINLATGAANTWTVTNGANTESAIAIKEVSGGGSGGGGMGGKPGGIGGKPGGIG